MTKLGVYHTASPLPFVPVSHTLVFYGHNTRFVVGLIGMVPLEFASPQGNQATTKRRTAMHFLIPLTTLPVSGAPPRLSRLAKYISIRHFERANPNF